MFGRMSFWHAMQTWSYLSDFYFVSHESWITRKPGASARFNTPTSKWLELEQPVDNQLQLINLLRLLYFTSILFAIPGDRTPNLTTITVTTNYYTPYPMRRPWSRLSHSLMAVHLMFTSRQILHHAYHTASHLGASCMSSPLYDPYLASCSSHVLLMTCTRPIGYDPLI